jgi:hypothetical protein
MDPAAENVGLGVPPLGEALANPHEPEGDAHFDAIDQFLFQTTDGISLPLLDAPTLQPWLECSNPTSWNTPQSNTANHTSSQLQATQPCSTQPHRRASEPDMPPSMPANSNSLVPFRDNDFSRLITTSKKKGWIGGLHIAAQRGHKQILQVLLLRSDMDVNQQDSDGRTPLIHAVIEDHESAARLLLAHGARIGILDCDARSAIHWAVLRQNVRILALLLNHRLEHEPELAIDTYDKTGWTPLHMAIERGFEPCLVLLLEMGADINAKAHKCPYVGNVMGNP